MKIYFDENDVVDFVITSKVAKPLKAETEAKARKLKNRAEKGNADAQFEVYKKSPQSKETLRWLCLAANQGHAFAQEEMGDLNRSNGKQNLITPNQIRAYVWYSLAASNGLKRAAFFRNQLSKDMTDHEVTEANHLVAEWKPNPAECE